MTTYSFETITPAQASTFSALDSLTFSGSANRASVTYNVATVTVSYGGQTLEFSGHLQSASLAGNVTFSDGSKLFIGDPVNNSITGTQFGDAMFGGAGADTLISSEGANLLQGNSGDDSLQGGSTDDTIYGGKDNDRIYTGTGNNFAQGNLGADTLTGDFGQDTLRGGQDNDTISGGIGNDWLSGDRGDDTVEGGLGADIFHTFGTAGVDRVLDFNRAQGDRVLVDLGTSYTVSQAGSDVVIEMGGGNRMVLAGVNISSLTGDWIFSA